MDRGDSVIRTVKQHSLRLTALLAAAACLLGGCSSERNQAESTALYSGEQHDELYQAISGALAQFQTEVTVSGDPDTASLTEVCSRIAQEHPEYFWFGGWSGTSTSGEKTQISFYVSESLSTAQRREMQQALLEQTEKIRAGIPDDADDFEKALYIHDYIVEHTAYTYDGAEAGNAYGCLMNHSAYCEGYSKAFLLLMNQLGIPAGICTGTARNANHAWNYLRLGGKYYWADVTWDDPVMENPADEQLCHYYCFVNDDLLFQTHQPGNNQYFTPVCGSTEMNYYVHTGRYLSSYDRKAVLGMFSDQLAENLPVLEVGFGSADALRAAIGDLFDDAHLWDPDALPSVPDSCTYSFCEETAALQVQLTPGTDSGEKA